MHNLLLLFLPEGEHSSCPCSSPAVRAWTTVTPKRGLLCIAAPCGPSTRRPSPAQPTAVSSTLPCRHRGRAAGPAAGPGQVLHQQPVSPQQTCTSISSVLRSAPRRSTRARWLCHLVIDGCTSRQGRAHTASPHGAPLVSDLIGGTLVFHPEPLQQH